jgi:hypothetical protein
LKPLHPVGNERNKVMNEILSTLSAILLTSTVANAGWEASQSSKPWLGVKQAPPASGYITAAAMPCAMCRVAKLTINEQVATKLSRGTVTETVAVDQCPRCGAKMVTTGLKQTKLVHTCGNSGNSDAFCCRAL